MWSVWFAVAIVVCAVMVWTALEHKAEVAGLCDCPANICKLDAKHSHMLRGLFKDIAICRPSPKVKMATMLRHRSKEWGFDVQACDGCRLLWGQYKPARCTHSRGIIVRKGEACWHRRLHKLPVRVLIKFLCRRTAGVFQGGPKFPRLNRLSSGIGYTFASSSYPNTTKAL